MAEQEATAAGSRTEFEALDAVLMQWLRDAQVQAGSAPPSVKLSPMQARFAWEWLIHEDNLLTTRGNFFLVAQSMMLAAYATLMTAATPGISLIAGVVAAVGIVISIVWLQVTNWSLEKTFWKLRVLARSAIPLYDVICEARKTRAGAHRLIGVSLPGLIAVMWVILLDAVVWTSR